MHLGQAVVGKETTPQPAHRGQRPVAPAVSHTPALLHLGHSSCMPKRKPAPLQPWHTLTPRVAQYMHPAAPSAAPGTPRALPATPPTAAAVPSATVLGTPTLPTPLHTMHAVWTPSTHRAPPQAVHAVRAMLSHSDDCCVLHLLHGCTCRFVNPSPWHTRHCDCKKWPRSRRLPWPLHAAHL